MKKGFTLIELLVVVLIIGILAAVALPQYRVSVAKTRVTEARVLVASLRESIKRYQLAYDSFPTKFDDLDITVPGTASGTFILVSDSLRCGISSAQKSAYCGTFPYTTDRFSIGIHMEGANALRMECMASKKDGVYYRTCKSLGGTEEHLNPDNGLPQFYLD